MSGHMTIRKAKRYLQRFSHARVLVIGDLILDHYIWGKVHRVSPEAPVPVVHVESESLHLGGAANVFKNLVSLGGKADLCGVVGTDESSHSLLKELGHYRRSRGGIVLDPARPTTRKTRIVAHNQQIVRYDVEEQGNLSSTSERKLLRYIMSRLRDISCIVVSDYAKGVVTASLMHELRRMATKSKIPIVVDPKVEHFSYYHGVTVITPNHFEAYRAVGESAGLHPTIETVGQYLKNKMKCQTVVITRGEQGMSLFEDKGESWHIPAMARQVYDVTGAGDTVVSTLALAISAGAPIRDAAILANCAAGIVVGMVGTASVTQAQLGEALVHA